MVDPSFPGIYLGGPVTELIDHSPSYAAQWREEFPEVLNSLEGGLLFHINNPCEGQYNERLEFTKEDFNSYLYQKEFIFSRCISQILNSQILVFNFLNCNISPGSYWEIGFGYSLKKPIIVITEKENLDPFVQFSTSFKAENLYEAGQLAVYLKDNANFT